MTLSNVPFELERIRTRTHRTTGVSAVLHILLVLLLSRMKVDTSVPEGLVEVMWLDPVPAAAAPPAPAVTPEQKPVNPAPRDSRIHFARETKDATAAPRPQDVAATQDRLRNRLASMQQDFAQTPLQVAGLGSSSLPSFSSLAGLPEGTGKSSAIGLNRGTSSLPPLDLSRGRGGPPGAAPALQKMQEAPAAPRGERPMASSGVTRQVLAGITLRGPVADRALLVHTRPEYPEWAQRELVEGSVRLYFEVLPDGRVKENVLVERTSGVEDFDRNATRALKSWRFEPVADGVGEQWGSITIDFRLNEARG